MSPQIEKLLKRVFNVVSIVGIIATILGAVYLYRIRAFTDETVLRNIVLSHRFGGPILFVVMQFIQVIIPIIPGGVTLAVGVLIFGPILGFVYNYIGIVLGSIVLFHIGRIYGQGIIRLFVKEKFYNKYMAIVERSQRRYNWIFFWLIVAPVAPDDALVLISSQTKMTWRFFVISLVIGKIPSILAYSYALLYGGELLKKLLGG